MDLILQPLPKKHMPLNHPSVLFILLFQGDLVNKLA